ncbi:hypothetical protein [Mesorhizobium sp.]|uniref:hypothetical protein n=1 Tax=Mesorhizobium sp. TaxID=1871066 RepID=UPI000FE6D781|nr:hypothetical protein [Mesorhizobium sp.]RWD81331.1 MAG: hypothetical protein EOS48_16755 [Mesorhizobium sp.]
MLIKVCPKCEGDGFLRVPVGYIDDRHDIAHATMIYADGTRWPAMSERPMEHVPPGCRSRMISPALNARALAKSNGAGA